MSPDELKKFNKKKAIILNNEVYPRERKFGSQIDLKLVDPIIMLEFRGQVNRQQVKQLLDSLFEVANG